MNEIKCPHNLNQFLLGEPIFENIYSGEECEKAKFYGDCYHCFGSAIAKRDRQLKSEQEPVLDKIRAEIEEQVLESLSNGGDDWFAEEKVNECLEIIDKYKAEGEDKG